MEAIAVEVVVEAKSACPDRTRAQAALADALANARAPKRATAATNGATTSSSWRVDVDVRSDENAKAIRTATARIIDDRGSVVAERTVSDRTACTPLTRAIGAWASLVLDDELGRARDAAENAPRDNTNVTANDKTPLASVKLDRSDWRTADDPDYVPTQYAKPWTLEIGLMGYVRDGLAATSGFAGGSLFAAFEVSPGWFVRPAVFYGTSTVQVALENGATARFTHYGLRGDFCRRFPGNYIERRGLELDLCAGGDVSGVTGNDSSTSSVGAMRASLGPSAAFRGEIGDTTNLEVRLAGGYNFLRDSMLREQQVAMIFGQAEFGLSWRFR